MHSTSKEYSGSYLSAYLGCRLLNLDFWTYFGQSTDKSVFCSSQTSLVPIHQSISVETFGWAGRGTRTKESDTECSQRRRFPPIGL